jgi:hypothetical protein
MMVAQTLVDQITIKVITTLKKTALYRLYNIVYCSNIAFSFNAFKLHFELYLYNIIYYCSIRTPPMHFCTFCS